MPHESQVILPSSLDLSVSLELEGTLISTLCTTTRNSNSVVDFCSGSESSFLLEVDPILLLSLLKVSVNNWGWKERKGLGLWNREHTQHRVDCTDTTKLNAFSFKKFQCSVCQTPRNLSAQSYKKIRWTKKLGGLWICILACTQSCHVCTITSSVPQKEMDAEWLASFSMVLQIQWADKVF